MSDYSEEDLFDLSDEDLEAAFKAAKAELGQEEIDLESLKSESSTLEEGDASSDDSDDELEFYEEEPENSQDSRSEEDDLEEADPKGEEGQPEEGPEPTEEAADTKSSDSKVHTFKANGIEYTVTEKEMMEKFPTVFAQAMNYTKKMQTIKPWRKTIDAIEQAKVSHEDINLMLDVLNGNKDALSEVLRRTGIDALDIEAKEDVYVPNDYGRDETAIALQDVINEIKTDPEYARTHKIVGEEWDEASWDTLKARPEDIKLLHIDIKSGMYDLLKPSMERLRVYDNGKHSDLEYYLEAARQYWKGQEQASEVQKMSAQLQAVREQQQATRQRVEAEAADRQSRKVASNKRKSAGITGTRAGNSGITDYLEASDEDYEAWYAKLQDSI